VVEVVEQMQAQLYHWERDGKIKLAPEIHLSAPETVRHGVKKLGIFHREKPLSFVKDEGIVSSNFRVLYFYHNRLKNYGLEKSVHWKSEEIEVLKVD